MKNTNTNTFNMEENKKSGFGENEKEIVFSQAIKAGKRIYYIDVKKNRKDEMYLSITESKKIVSGEGENATISFEKHKIFLYREDFAKFTNSLNEAIKYVVDEQGEYRPNYPAATEEEGESKMNIDIEFWNISNITHCNLLISKIKRNFASAFKTSCDGELSK